MLNRQCGQVGIVGQIVGGTGRKQQSGQDAGVAFCRVQKPSPLVCHPFIDQASGARNGQRLGKDRCAG